MSEPSLPRPETGHEAVDAALASVAETPVDDPAARLAQLTAAHEALHAALALEH